MRKPSVIVSILCPGKLFAATVHPVEPPSVGKTAPNFTLKSIEGTTVELGKLAGKGPVVVVMLRGWPGYQCPICDRQVQDFIRQREEFTKRGASLVFVYPGPTDGLNAHAAEFKTMKGKQWPAEFLYLLDPDYAMVNDYGLRWDAPRETAYPATFVLDARGIVRYALVSKTHGGRTKASDVLAEVGKASKP